MSASPIGANHGASLVAGPFRGLAAKSDKRLVELAQRGDTHAVEILYDRYATAILRYCRSLLRSTQEAEDVQQEVFVQALSALRDGAGPGQLPPLAVPGRPQRLHLAHAREAPDADRGRRRLRGRGDHRAAGQRRARGTAPAAQRSQRAARRFSAARSCCARWTGSPTSRSAQVLGLPVTTVRSTIFRARSTLQGLAEARDAKCTEIQAELSRLADRRGRRSRQITSHLKVCGDCRDFRDGLRERQTILRGFMPVVPLGVFGGAETIAAEGAGIATGAAASAPRAGSACSAVAAPPPSS